MLFSPTSCHFISLRSKHSPEHTVPLNRLLYKNTLGFYSWGTMIEIRLQYLIY
jgi:hypothetical protein